MAGLSVEELIAGPKLVDVVASTGTTGHNFDADFTIDPEEIARAQWQIDG